MRSTTKSPQLIRMKRYRSDLGQTWINTENYTQFIEIIIRYSFTNINNHKISDFQVTSANKWDIPLASAPFLFFSKQVFQYSQTSLVTELMSPDEATWRQECDPNNFSHSPVISVNPVPNHSTTSFFHLINTLQCFLQDEAGQTTYEPKLQTHLLISHFNNSALSSRADKPQRGPTQWGRHRHNLKKELGRFFVRFTFSQAEFQNQVLLKLLCYCDWQLPHCLYS